MARRDTHLEAVATIRTRVDVALAVHNKSDILDEPDDANELGDDMAGSTTPVGLTSSSRKWVNLVELDTLSRRHGLGNLSTLIHSFVRNVHPQHVDALNGNIQVPATCTRRMPWTYFLCSQHSRLIFTKACMHGTHLLKTSAMLKTTSGATTHGIALALAATVSC